MWQLKLPLCEDIVEEYREKLHTVPEVSVGDMLFEFRKRLLCCV